MAQPTFNIKIDTTALVEVIEAVKRQSDFAVGNLSAAFMKSALSASVAGENLRLFFGKQHIDYECLKETKPKVRKVWHK